ncbi:unnamed protein product [Owenia fusiformis]|uniref:Peptidase S1 domain-containing protein n=1 Tax=Owenia fusiformis TaxID=6347 RepID=A0A8S4NUM2_OWEFU|nr:unnamed protein product [Owenia fusiformis]
MILRTLAYRYVFSRFQTFWILQIIIIAIATTAVAQEPCAENKQYPLDSPCEIPSDCPNAYKCKDGVCCMYPLPCDAPLRNDDNSIAECKMEKNRPCPKGYICNADEKGRFTVCCPEKDKSASSKVTTCTYNGKTYNEGDVFKMEDKCNKCKCKPKGKLSCSDKKSCKKCKVKGKVFKKGEKYMDECDECTCISPKLQTCEKRECKPSKYCDFNGKLYQEGDEFEAEDKCNKCTCSDGEVECGDKNICKKCKIDGKVYKRGDTYMVECNECKCISPKVQTCEKKDCTATNISTVTTISTPVTTISTPVTTISTPVTTISTPVTTISGPVTTISTPVTTTTSTTTTTTTTPQTTTTGRPTTTAPPRKLLSTCGKSSALSSKRKKRIVNGTEIIRDAHPWMALVMETRATRPPQTVYCGGALIHPSWVITSKACVSEWKVHLESRLFGGGQTFLHSIGIRLGRYNLSLRAEPDDFVATPLKVFFHPNKTYDDILYWPIYNIALIKIKPVPLSHKIQPACISDIDLEPKSMRYSNKRCFFAGWGTKGPTDRYVMLQSPMELESKASCVDYVSEVEPDLAHLAGEDVHLCAKATDDSEPAEDDGGGPLVCEIDGAWHLQGIGSWNPIPSDGRAIVTRIFKIFDWIKFVIENH